MTEEKVYSGTVKEKGGKSKAVHLVEAPRPRKRYPFAWGVVVCPPLIFGPRRHALCLPEVLMVGLPRMQNRVLGYLILRSFRERTSVLVNSWSFLAWDLLGSKANDGAVRRAVLALADLSVLRIVKQRPLEIVLSPLMFYPWSLEALEKTMPKVAEEWKPSEAAWKAFWDDAPKNAPFVKSVRSDTEEGELAGLMQDFAEEAAKARADLSSCLLLNS